MSIDTNGPKIYFTLFGGISITQTVLSSCLVTVILCVSGYCLGRNLQKRPGPAQVLVETGVDMLYRLVGETMGRHNLQWAPYIGALFLSSLLGSLIGMTGFLRPTTADLSITLTWAVMTSGIIWYQSIKHNGVLGWLKGFTQPIAVMTPMNIVSEIAQPISMAFRHFGNLVGGSVITSMLYTALAGVSSLVLNRMAKSGLWIGCVALGAALLTLGVRGRKTWRKVAGILLAVVGVLALLEQLDVLTGVPIFQVGLPAVLSLYFDVFSGIIQAFVFCLLSMVYIGSACPPPADA